MGRAPCCDKSKVKRGPWSPDEDATLKSYLHLHGTGGNWITLPKKAGLKRCGKSCRLRWLNFLRPDIKHGCFKEEEDNIIFNLYSQMGSRWSLIASHLPRRTDNDVKNHWNTKLKKKLLLAGKTNQEIKNTTINPSSISCSQSLLQPFIPKSEPNSSNLFTFWDSTTQNSDTLPMLRDINQEPTFNTTHNTLTLDPILQFSCSSFSLNSGLNSINSHITWSPRPGSSNGDINLEEDRILMDYGFNFPNH